MAVLLRFTKLVPADEAKDQPGEAYAFDAYRNDQLNEGCHGERELRNARDPRCTFPLPSPRTFPSLVTADVAPARICPTFTNSRAARRRHSLFPRLPPKTTSLPVWTTWGASLARKRNTAVRPSFLSPILQFHGSPRSQGRIQLSGRHPQRGEKKQMSRLPTKLNRQLYIVRLPWRTRRTAWAPRAKAPLQKMPARQRGLPYSLVVVDHSSSHCGEHNLYATAKSSSLRADRAHNPRQLALRALPLQTLRQTRVRIRSTQRFSRCPSQYLTLQSRWPRSQVR